MTVFANRGERVTCDRGHIICTVAEPLQGMTPMTANLFTNWQQDHRYNAPIRPCQVCGAPWLRSVAPGGFQIRLETGWRG
jgi:hypothetical protein